MKDKQEKILGTNERIEMLGATIDVLDMKDTVDLVEKYILAKEPLHLMGVNADKINELREMIENMGGYNETQVEIVSDNVSEVTV